MSVSSKDVKAAVALLDQEDPAQWAAPGVPTLEALQLLVPEATADDLTAAGFADMSTETVINKETGAAPVVEATADEVAPSELPPPDSVNAELAMAIVSKAQAALRAIDANVAQANDARSQITADLEKLVVRRDRQLHIIESYSSRVSFAASVKAIQKQTAEQLVARQAKAKELQKAHLVNGTVFPSALDASMAQRRKTPEQAANLAAFITQRAAAQIAERG